MIPHGIRFFPCQVLSRLAITDSKRFGPKWTGWHYDNLPQYIIRRIGKESVIVNDLGAALRVLVVFDAIGIKKTTDPVAEGQGCRLVLFLF